ncbi:MAG TPA: glycosyltransferase family 1 protein [Blastocatellia bacterium]|nr:glycosyltransferase family 1 protein [Blastocatellia bacterium]
MRSGDRAIVFSQNLKQLAAAGSPKLANAAVIYHGIDWGERERNAPSEFSVLEHYGVRQPYLLYVSQFHRYKNVPRLLEAFARLRDSTELSLVLVGKPADEAYEREIVQAIARFGLQLRVKMIPGVKREQLKPLYRSAQGFIYPSLVENCPFAVLEALAYGLPIGTSNQSALPEVAGEAAVYFNPYSVAEMAQAMERLVWDENLRGELRENAIAQAAKFTWEQTARQTLHVFEAIGQKTD